LYILQAFIFVSFGQKALYLGMNLFLVSILTCIQGIICNLTLQNTPPAPNSMGNKCCKLGCDCSKCKVTYRYFGCHSKDWVPSHAHPNIR